jgi:hypothetical protein
LPSYWHINLLGVLVSLDVTRTTASTSRDKHAHCHFCALSLQLSSTPNTFVGTPSHQQAACRARSMKAATLLLLLATLAVWAACAGACSVNEGTHGLQNLHAFAGCACAAYGMIPAAAFSARRHSVHRCLVTRQPCTPSTIQPLIYMLHHAVWATTPVSGQICLVSTVLPARSAATADRFPRGTNSM